MLQSGSRLAKVLFMIGLLGFSGPGAAESPLRFATLAQFKLQSGAVLPQCRVGYRTLGRLNATASNAVLVPTYFMGDTKGHLPYLGPGKLVDTTRFFVVLVDALGNGVSASPSLSGQPGQFPAIAIADMVASQHRLLTEHLKINQLHAVVGVSMGGMQAYQWAVQYPGFAQRIVPIIGTPQQSFQDLLFWNTQLAIIERACPGQEAKAMEAVGLVHAGALFTPEHRARQSRTEFAAFLEKEMRSYAQKNAFDWAAQLRAMLGHDSYRTVPLAQLAQTVKAKMLIIYASTDQMVNPLNNEPFAKALGARTLVFANNCGHMATGCEFARLGKEVRGFLEE
jgi:homoserine O-acetyltransferase/O-succinyltransferase